MNDLPLVLHVGMQQAGATMIQRALGALRPQLRHHGVAFIAHDQIAALSGADGWLVRVSASLAKAQAFEEQVAALVERELEATRSPRVVLISSDHLMGRSNLHAADGMKFRPFAETAIEQLISALQPDTTEICLITRRQDRLMEFCYVREIQQGAHHALEDQFPYRFDPVFDYTALIERLMGISDVSRAWVRPFELVEAGPRPFVDHLLGVVGLSGQLDLTPVRPYLKAHHVYNRRGVALARAMNPLLDTEEERHAVRRYLKQQYGCSDDHAARVLPRAERRKILVSYREVNEQLFALHMPDFPHDSYARHSATVALADRLPPARGRRSLGWSARWLAGRAVRRIRSRG